MTVAELLTASRESHAAYRTLHTQAAQAKQKKPNGWQVHLWDALTLRQRAAVLDPRFLDPAWSEDTAWANHEAITAFYERQLGLENLEDGEGAARR